VSFEGLDRLSSVAREWIESEDPVAFLERNEDSVASRLLGAEISAPHFLRLAFDSTTAPQAVATADRLGERVANTAHLVIAASQGDNGEDDPRGLVARLEKMRENELSIRGHRDGLTHTPQTQAPPDARVHSFSQQPVEIRRVLTLLREASSGDIPVTTSQVLGLLGERLPARWEWFLGPFGLKVADIVRGNVAEDGTAWVYASHVKGRHWLSFSRTNQNGAVELSLPCAESLWRALAVANTHGVLWYPDLIALTALAVPGAATRDRFARGCPRGLDLVWAAFANFGHVFAAEDAIMDCPIEVLDRPSTSGTRIIGDGELDSWIVDAQSSATFLALLGSSTEPPLRATCLSDDGLAGLELRTVLGARLVRAVSQGRNTDANAAASALSDALLVEGCFSNASQVAEVSQALDGDEIPRPLRAPGASDDLQSAYYDLLAASALVDVESALWSHPQLLGEEWDHVLSFSAMDDLPPIRDTHQGIARSRAIVVSELREVGRARGLSWATAWVGSQNDDQLAMRYGIADEFESRVRAALDNWSAGPTNRLRLDELVKLLRASALVSPPAQAGRHSWFCLKVLAGFAEMRPDEDLLELGLDISRISRTHMTHGDLWIAEVAASLFKLRWIADSQNPRSDSWRAAASELALAATMVPGPQGLLRLFALSARACLWPGGPGVDAAERCLAIARRFETAASELSVDFAEAVEAVRRSARASEHPVDVARHTRDTALARARSQGLSIESDSEVIEWTVKTGLLSDDEHEIDEALKAAGRLSQADSSWFTANLLCRKHEAGRASRAEALAAVQAAWSHWLPRRSLTDVMAIGRLRLALVEDGTHADLLDLRQDIFEATAERLDPLADSQERIRLSRHLNAFLHSLARAFAISGYPRDAVISIEAGRGVLVDSWHGTKFRDSDRIEQDFDSATEDDVTLVYLTSYGDDHAAYVVHRGLATDYIPLDIDRDELLQHVIAFGAANLPDASQTDLFDSVHPFGAWLWPRVVEPIRDRAIPDGSRVCFILLGLFSPVPIQIAWEPSGDSADLRRYVLDVWEPTFAPSASLRAAGVRRKTPLAFGRIVAVAPEGAGPFPALAYAPREVLEAGSHFEDADLLTGELARIDRVNAALSRPHDVFHFAGHGISLLEEGRQLLVLSEANAIDVTNFRDWYSGRLAVASACQSAIADPTRPEEGLSVASALVASGYDGAIGNQWSVSDLATTLLLSEFYRRLAASDSPSERLREAQLWLRNAEASQIVDRYPWTRRALVDAPTIPFQDPSFWAGATYLGV
jgi:hypothetical protein